MIRVEAPSVTQLVLASGTPLYRDPYRKVGQIWPGHRRSVLLDDPVEAFGEVGKNALTWLLFEVLTRAGGNLTLVPSGPNSERATPIAAGAEAPHPLLADVFARVALLSDASVRERADETLLQLGAHLPADCDQLPPFVLSRLDDGAALVEWPLPGRRLGFVFHAEKVDSGWFFVSDADWGNIMASGALDDAQMEQLVGWALNLRDKS